MINISNTLKQACNGDKLTYREYVVLSGTTTQIDVATEMYATAYKDTHFIGTFNMKYIKFTTSNDVKYRNKELTLYKEINGESFKVGNFIVTEIKDNDSNEEVTVTAYDYGLKFAQPYESNLNYSTGNITLKDVLDEICENVGVGLVNQTITNGDFIVDSNQFVNGEMYGDVISAIAFMSGDFATINSDDKLKLVFNTTTDEIIEDYVDLEDKRDTRPITSLSIGTSQVQGQNAVIKDEDLIAEYGEHWLEINDVPFAYTLEKRERLKTAIFDKVKGFGYSSFKSEYAFKPYLELGDLIQFKNKEGQLINSIILRITSKYDNIILEAPSITDASIDYEMPQTVYDVAKRAEVIANQNTAEINALSRKIVDISQEITSAGIVNITDASSNGLHKLSIRGNISLILPNDMTDGTNATKTGIYKSGVTKSSSYVQYSEGTFPSENLFPLTMNLIVSQEDQEDKIYELPFDYLRSLGDVYDEFVCLDGNMSLIRRIGLKTNGEKYILKNEIVEDLGFVNIEIPEGNSTIRLQWFDSAIFNIVYLLKNEYTSVFASQVEFQNEINVRSEEIEILSKKKVNNDEIISSINVSPEEIEIDSSKLSLKGKEIDLTGDNITINSTNFNVDKEGNVLANSFTGNNAKLNDVVVDGGAININTDTFSQGIIVGSDNAGTKCEIRGSSFNARNSSNENTIIMMFNTGTISCVSLVQTSLEENKKNFEKYENALDEIKKIDIYKYNLKNEEDNHKKHLGFIIGENYNYSKEITAVDNEENEIGVDNYAMTSLCLQAIKEQQSIIEKLEKRIEELENEKNNIENDIQNFETQ